MGGVQHHQGFLDVAIRRLHNCAPFIRLFSHSAYKPCYGLTVGTPSDTVVCKVKSWLSHLRSCRRSAVALRLTMQRDCARFLLGTGIPGTGEDIRVAGI